MWNPRSTLLLYLSSAMGSRSHTPLLTCPRRRQKTKLHLKSCTHIPIKCKTGETLVITIYFFCFLFFLFFGIFKKFSYFYDFFTFLIFITTNKIYTKTTAV
ncbi:hypothetical protein Hanom_Chr06g00523881 [Helianthus anomalus]